MFALHCTGWQVSSDDCNMICERNVSPAREGSPSLQLKQPATQILTALLLQQRRWDRPLGTAHFATVKCQLIQQCWPSKSQNLQFDQWDESSVSVRSGQIFWKCEGLPSRKVAPIKSQCPLCRFCTVECQIGIYCIDKLGFAKLQFNCFSAVFTVAVMLWIWPTCLSSKGPKPTPHHLGCSLANHSVHENSSPW